MARWLTAPAALPEVQIQYPVHIAVDKTVCNFSSKESDILLLLKALHVCGAQTHKQAKDPYAKNKIKTTAKIISFPYRS